MTKAAWECAIPFTGLILALINKKMDSKLWNTTNYSSFAINPKDSAATNSIYNSVDEARFIRRISVSLNAIQPIDNELFVCLNCIRRDGNSTYKTGLRFFCLSSSNMAVMTSSANQERMIPAIDEILIWAIRTKSISSIITAV